MILRANTECFLKVRESVDHGKKRKKQRLTTGGRASVSIKIVLESLRQREGRLLM